MSHEKHSGSGTTSPEVDPKLWSAIVARVNQLLTEKNDIVEADPEHGTVRRRVGSTDQEDLILDRELIAADVDRGRRHWLTVSSMTGEGVVSKADFLEYDNFLSSPLVGQDGAPVSITDEPNWILRYLAAGFDDTTPGPRSVEPSTDAITRAREAGIENQKIDETGYRHDPNQ